MTPEQLLINAWRDLPNEQQSQLLDFAEFLRSKRAGKQKNQKVKRRFPIPELAGKVEIKGDIVSPIVDEDDWDCQT